MPFLKVACGSLCLLASESALANETITYGYDALGRLTIVSHSGSVNTGTQAAYAYDHASNRTRVVISGAAVQSGGGSPGGGGAAGGLGGPVTDQPCRSYDLGGQCVRY